MTKIDLLLSHGVYTAWIDLVTGKTFPIPSADSVAPIESFPQTFTSLREAQEVFPNCEFNIIGNKVSDSTAAVSDQFVPSAEELAVLMKQNSNRFSESQNDKRKKITT